MTTISRGNVLFSIAVISVSIFITSVAGLQCYRYTSGTGTIPNNTESSKLSENAQKIPCSPDETLCMKVFNLRIEYVNDTPTWYGSFDWSCGGGPGFDVYTLLGPGQCGDTFEMTDGDNSGTRGDKMITFQRQCTCCGEACNGPEMDDSCNDYPKFTHNCYDADSESNEPKLPGDSMQIPCTAKESCLKADFIMPSEELTNAYHWLCATPPDGLPCGWWNYSSGGNEAGQDVWSEKICTCCGDLCNGADLDAIKASDLDCSNSRSAGGDNNGRLITMGATMGAALGVLLIALVIAVFYIFRLKTALANTKPDCVQMVHEQS